jgi:parallel beta-helix repeat protein/predicted outer membrane repeat protein
LSTTLLSETALYYYLDIIDESPYNSFRKPQLITGPVIPQLDVNTDFASIINSQRGEVTMRYSVLLLTSVLLTVCVSILRATIIHVPADYERIQVAIAAAVSGDTVMVADGTYTGQYNRDIEFGGKAVVVMSENGPEVTIIDCEGSSSDPHRGFYVHDGEDSSTVVQGFTIMNGYARDGGGIYCENSSPTIAGNIIIGNTADVNGGGICLSNSASTVLGNTVTGNNGTYNGGGIYCLDCSPIIENNTIIDNRTFWSWGGGIHCENASPTIIDNTISENDANAGGGLSCGGESSPSVMYNEISGNSGYTNGGGIYIFKSSPIIEGNTITVNDARDGGGIRCDSTAATIICNTFTGNTADQRGGGIYSANSSVIVTNCILWGDSAGSSAEIYIGYYADITVSYSDVEGSWQGEGNIADDPLFRDPAASDFHLMAIDCGDADDSPCIDAGNPAIIDSSLNCSWGLGTVLSDMGAFCGGDSAEVSIGDIEKNNRIPLHFSLAQNYPNPFNPTTTISFDIPGDNARKQYVSMKIFDLRGRHVRTLLDSTLEPGNHRLVWDGRNGQGEYVSSGIYLYTLRSEDKTYTRKMVISK